MPDIKEVIKGLKCIKGDIVFCKECGYSDENGFGTYMCRKNCASDAIELLKRESDAIELLKREQKLIKDTIEEAFTKSQQNILESQSNW